ncbi:MAG TPA: TadE/TadG family type IV pilus assembly protein [Phenylobacterium sp.]|nr:TadE/TadG family type IV pilus assembly protein [Phenylobacterium sp.]
MSAKAQPGDLAAPRDRRASRRSRGRNFIRERSGSAAVEFAVVMPVLLILLAGLAQFAWVQHCSTSLRYALSAASRQLLLNPNLTEAQMRDAVKAKLAAADPNVTVSLSIATVASGKVATLNGVYAHTISLPGLPSIPLDYHASVQTPLPAF